MVNAPQCFYTSGLLLCMSQPTSYIHVNQKQLIMSKTISLSDLEWDFSDEDEVTLSLPKGIELTISKDELNDFIESWKENFEDDGDE